MEKITIRKPGGYFSLTVIRNGRVKDIQVAPKDLKSHTKAKRTNTEVSEILRELGLGLIFLMKKASGLYPDEGGINIEKLYPGKFQRKTGKAEGLIIAESVRPKVTTMEELVENLELSSGDVSLHSDAQKLRCFGLSTSCHHWE